MGAVAAVWRPQGQRTGSPWRDLSEDLGREQTEDGREAGLRPDQ